MEGARRRRANLRRMPRRYHGRARILMHQDDVRCMLRTQMRQTTSSRKHTRLSSTFSFELFREEGRVYVGGRRTAANLGNRLFTPKAWIESGWVRGEYSLARTSERRLTLLDQAENSVGERKKLKRPARFCDEKIQSVNANAARINRCWHPPGSVDSCSTRPNRHNRKRCARECCRYATCR